MIGKRYGRTVVSFHTSTSLSTGGTIVQYGSKDKAVNGNYEDRLPSSKKKLRTLSQEVEHLFGFLAIF